MNPQQPQMPQPTPQPAPQPVPQSIPQPVSQPIPQTPQPTPQISPAPQTQPAPTPQVPPTTPQPAPQPVSQPAAQPQPTTPQPTPQSAPQQPTRPGQPQQPGQQPPQPTPPQNATPDLPTSTQSTLLISELRDGLVIMKDGSFRAVIACQSINFDLMSETEREGVEYSYQNFLNSLNFTTQILIRSQRVDIGPYIERLSEIRRNNENMLLGVLMDDYINFIDILSQEANIMDKSFFIIIPYYPDADAEKAIQQVKGIFGGKKKPTEVTKIDRITYDKAITEINNRVESVVSGLFQIGIRSVRLNTKELAALYYNFNNPDTAVREPLVDFGKLATTYVKKGEKDA